MSLLTSRTTSIIEYGYGRDQVGAVIVNGTELPANNASDRVDVGTLLKMGENTITIRLHSTLYGRTYAEHSGYQDNRVEYGMGKGIMDPPDPDAYYNGLLRVRVVPYKKKEGGMVGQLRNDTGGIRGLGKVEIVYLDNTNLAYLLGHESADIGNIRETFFYNQMRVKSDVISSRKSDFEIDGKTFEVGGKKKKQKQIQDATQGYVVKDDIETGYGNIIPLWQFGLTY